MNTSDILALISLCFAISSIIYTAVTNREKFVISSSERKNILDWYERTNRILIELKMQAQLNDTKNKQKLLIELSNLVEIGRFYFPNVDKKDNFGAHKPIAYQGYRSLILEFLVMAYEIGQRKDLDKYSEHIDILRREFTSNIFHLLKPRNYIVGLSKNSFLHLKSDFILEDFIESNPNKFVFYN